MKKGCQFRSNLVAGKNTCKDSYEGDSDLYGRQEPVRILCEIQRTLRRFAALGSLCLQT